MKGHRLTCTFCRRPEHQVRKLVAGSGVYICDQCIDLAHRIVSTDEPPAAQAPWQRVAARLHGLARSLRGHFRLRFAPRSVV